MGIGEFGFGFSNLGFWVGDFGSDLEFSVCNFVVNFALIELILALEISANLDFLFRIIMFGC